VKVQNAKKDAANQELNKEIEKLKADLAAKVTKLLDASKICACSPCICLYMTRSFWPFFHCFCSTTLTGGHGHKGCGRNTENYGVHARRHLSGSRQDESADTCFAGDIFLLTYILFSPSVHHLPCQRIRCLSVCLLPVP